jgi:hypothetical protein
MAIWLRWIPATAETAIDTLIVALSALPIAGRHSGSQS